MDRSNNTSATLYGLGAVGVLSGLKIHYTYPEVKFTWSFWQSPTTGKVGPSILLRSTLRNAGISILSNNEIAPNSNTMRNPSIAVRNYNGQMAVEEYARRLGSSARNIAIDRSAVPTLYNIEGNFRWTDVYHEKTNWWRGTTSYYTEVKTGYSRLSSGFGLEGFQSKTLIDKQVAADIRNFAALKEQVAFPRAVGAVVKNSGAALGVAGLAWDTYETGSAIAGYYQQENYVAAGREVAGFAGRFAGAAAGASFGAQVGLIFGPFGAVAGGIIGGAAGAYAGGWSFSGAYGDIFGADVHVSDYSMKTDLSAIDYSDITSRDYSVVDYNPYGFNLVDFLSGGIILPHTPYDLSISSGIDQSVSIDLDDEDLLPYNARPISGYSSIFPGSQSSVYGVQTNTEIYLGGQQFN